MLASASHDMKTPLNTIITMHDLLEQSIPDSKSQEYLKISRTSTNLLNILIDDTLDYI
jgi:signal transduction histidine kinase